MKVSSEGLEVPQKDSKVSDKVSTFRFKKFQTKASLSEVPEVFQASREVPDRSGFFQQLEKLGILPIKLRGGLGQPARNLAPCSSRFYGQKFPGSTQVPVKAR